MGFFSDLWRAFGRVAEKPARSTSNRRIEDIRQERLALQSRSPVTPPPQPSRIADRLDRIKAERLSLDRKSDPTSTDPLYNGQWVPVSGSSNVAAFRYLIEQESLEVEFLDGSMYGYMRVPLWKAKGFFAASSKGKAVWDYLRIRGTKLGHQHDYVMQLGPSRGAGKSIAIGFGTRKWERTSKTAARHAKVVERQSRGAGGYASKKQDPNWESTKKKARKR